MSPWTLEERSWLSQKTARKAAHRHEAAASVLLPITTAHCLSLLLLLLRLALAWPFFISLRGMRIQRQAKRPKTKTQQEIQTSGGGELTPFF
jgi:hypothetical protein